MHGNQRRAARGVHRYRRSFQSERKGDPTRDQYVQGNFLLGISLLKSDRAADAVNAFTTVLQYDRYNPVASMNLGICYVELKQYFRFLFAGSDSTHTLFEFG